MTNSSAPMYFAALGDPTRLAIFELLAKGSRAVGDIASHLPVSRPAVSQHLRVLERAQLVQGRRQGVRSIYSINQQGVEEMRKYLEIQWDEALLAFKEEAERN